MGWDLTILNVVDGSLSIDEIGETSIEPLGTKETVIQKLIEVFPYTDRSDPDWLVFQGEHYSLEFSLGANNEIDSFMIHVHGDNEGAVNAIARLYKHTGWSVLDAAIGDFIDFRKDSVQEGYSKWREYKHHVQNILDNG